MSYLALFGDLCDPTRNDAEVKRLREKYKFTDQGCASPLPNPPDTDSHGGGDLPFVSQNTGD